MSRLPLFCALAFLLCPGFLCAEAPPPEVPYEAPPALRADSIFPAALLTGTNGFPVCLARDGFVAVALHLDYAIWSPVTDRFIQALLRPQGLTPTGFKIVLSGTVSPVLRQQLLSQQITITDQLSSAVAR